MKDDELTSPEAFSLAVRSRASFLARSSGYDADRLRPFSQLTLLLGMGLDETAELLRARGLRGAYRWAMSGGALAVDNSTRD